jgi:hypothetical protein
MAASRPSRAASGRRRNVLNPSTQPSRVRRRPVLAGAATVRPQIIRGEMRGRRGLRARIARLEAAAVRKPADRQAARVFQEAKEDLDCPKRALEYLETLPERSS